MIAVGCRFDDIGTGFWSLRIPPTLIHINIDEIVIGKVYSTKLGIVGDAKEVLRQLLAKIKNKPCSKAEERKKMLGEIRQKADEEKEKEVSTHKSDGLINPQRALLVLKDCLDRDAIVCAGVGNNGILMWDFPVYRPHSFLTPSGFQSMGFAVPAAVAAKLNYPDRSVVCVCGDGGFAMSAMELATALENKANIVIIIFDDGKYGAINVAQEIKYGGRHIAVDRYNPDFLLFARAFGAKGLKVEKEIELKPALEEALANDVLTIVDLKIDPNCFPPLLLDTLSL
jgi:acetolactate synthase-1/2/3 large subunit